MGAKAISPHQFLLFNTLGYLTPNSENLSNFKTIKKRAKRKYIQYKLLFKLIELNSPLLEQYWQTFYCARHVTFGLDSTGSFNMVSKYCKKRWCLVCNSISAANKIIGYRKGIQKITDPVFMTLTTKNVSSKELPNAINNYFTTSRNISKALYKANVKSAGIRKIECTFNSDNNSFHPHLHVICNRSFANRFHQEWLRHQQTSAHAIAQDIRTFNTNDLIEIFKYFTDFFTKKNKPGEKQKRIFVPAWALDCIYKSIARRRVLQPFGNLRKEYKKRSTADTILIRQVNAKWDQELTDWITEQGEQVTGYTPSKDIKNLVSQITKT